MTAEHGAPRGVGGAGPAIFLRRTENRSLPQLRYCPASRGPI
jgi:hypothetical protein